jgi:hypothetical protein
MEVIARLQDRGAQRLDHHGIGKVVFWVPVVL